MLESKDICIDKHGQLKLTFDYDVFYTFSKETCPDTLTLSRDATEKVYALLSSVAAKYNTEKKPLPWN